VRAEIDEAAIAALGSPLLDVSKLLGMGDQVVDRLPRHPLLARKFRWPDATRKGIGEHGEGGEAVHGLVPV
jgi:hypothetical protein